MTITLNGTTGITTPGLTDTGTATFSSGTANGVAYLNGSTVLTTGTALTFDGTNLGVGGSAAYPIDVTSTNARVRVAPSTTTNYALFQATNAGNTAYIGLDNSAGGLTAAYALNLYHNGAYPITFSTTGTERARLDANGNLGVGTSSPAQKLQVSQTSAGHVYVAAGNTGTSGYGGGYKFLSYDYTNAGALSAEIGYYYGGASDQASLRFSLQGNSTQALTEYMRLDRSGNLGLGVTPSAWGGALTGSMQFKSGGFAISSGSGIAYLTNNTYYNGTNWIYTASDYATRYLMVNGQHQWFTAASGTVGNAVTWTQGMALDALSNLSLSSGTTGNCFISFANTVDGGTQGYVGDAKALIGSSSNSFLGVRGESGIAFGIGSSEKARIDSSGNLGLGVTPSSWGLGRAIEIGAAGNGIWNVNNQNVSVVCNTYYQSSSYKYASTAPASSYQQAGGIHYWYTAASGTAGTIISYTQAMTLDASSVLNVGTTGNNFHSFQLSLPNGLTGQFKNTNTTNGYGIDVVSASAAGTGWSLMRGWAGTTTQVLAIYGNGNIQNTNNSYGALSDVKLKENIVDATPKLVDLMKVRVRSYNLKSNPDHKQIGVIAQELEEVFPSMVEESPDCDEKCNDLGTTTKSVKYSVFVPMLIKAIQELKAELDALKGLK